MIGNRWRTEIGCWKTEIGREDRKRRTVEKTENRDQFLDFRFRYSFQISDFPTVFGFLLTVFNFYLLLFTCYL